jgi:hypothetical protein
LSVMPVLGLLVQSKRDGSSIVPSILLTPRMSFSLWVMMSPNLRMAKQGKCPLILYRNRSAQEHSI